MLSAIGDLHIDAQSDKIPEYTDKVLSTFERVVQKEIDKGASAIVQLGDVFDSAYPEQIHIAALLRTLRANASVPIFFLMGNHDFADVGTNSLSLVKLLCRNGFINGKVITKPTILKIDGEKYFFCPHPYTVDEPPKARYCFGHFGYDGAKGDNGYVLKTKYSPKGRWILGDYHTAQRGKNYIYPGALAQVKFHETTDRYIVRLDDAPEHVAIVPDIKLGRCRIESEEDLAGLDKDTYWSVNIGRGANLPPNWASKYPHIVAFHTEKLVSKRAQILMKQVASEDPLEGLEDYLRNEGMSDKHIRIAMKFLGR